MQCTRLVGRPLCTARNAFSVTAALTAAFASPCPRWNYRVVRSILPQPAAVTEDLQQYTSLIDSFDTLAGEPVSRTRQREGRGATHVSLKKAWASGRSVQAVGHIESGDASHGKDAPERIFQTGKRAGEKKRFRYREARKQTVHQPAEPPIRGLSLFHDVKRTDPKIYARLEKCLGKDIVTRITALPEEPEQPSRHGLPPDWKERMHLMAELAHVAAKIKPHDIDGATREVLRRAMLYRATSASTENDTTAENDTMRQTLPIPWAVRASHASSLTASQRLDEEIANFARFVQPTPAEAAARQAVRHEACALIRHVMASTISPELFGSETTGLALATSDLDIRIRHRAGEHHAYALDRGMRRLFRAMRDCADYICVVYRHAKYPIINAQHKATGLDIQIVSSPSTTKQQELTRQYLAELPHLRDLYFVVRTLLGTRGLIDVYNGGTGSYGTFIMLVGALVRGLRSATLAATLTTPSSQLLHFLHFYFTFPTHTRGLTLTPVPKLFPKHAFPSAFDLNPTQNYIQSAHRRSDPVRAGQWAISQLRPLQPYLLCLQDPANSTNDLGRKSNAILYIMRTFRSLYDHVMEGVDRRRRSDRNAKDGGNAGGRMHGAEESLLLPLVGRGHEVDSERRRRLEEYGRGVLERRTSERKMRPRDSSTEVAAKRAAVVPTAAA